MTSLEADDRKNEMKSSLIRILLPAILWISIFIGVTFSCGTPTPAPASTPLLTPLPSLDSQTVPEPADQSLALLPGSPPIPPNLTYYTLRLELDYERHAFQGHASVDYTNTEDRPLESLYFRLYPNGGQTYGNGSMSLTQAKVNGQPTATIASVQDSVIEVSLPQPLDMDQHVRLDFDFSGRVPVDFGVGGSQGGYGNYNFSQGVLALANWYPILAVYDGDGWNLDPVYPLGDAVYSDIALYTVELTAPADLVVVASGVETLRQSQESQTLYRFVSGPARDFFIIASPDFLVSQSQLAGITLNAYYLPGDAEGGQQALQVASQSLAIFNDLFGAYPYTEFDVVEAPMNNAGGVEYPGIVLIETERYSDPQNPTFITTVAHEAAHQWWYNIVGNDVIDEPWLDEALAAYTSCLYWEQSQGSYARDQLLTYYQQAYERIALQGLDAPVSAGVPYFADPERAASYSPIVYAKGALFLHAIRQVVGDSAFFAALQQYYRAGQWNVATAADLLGIFEATSGRTLDALYQAWLSFPRSPTETIPTISPTPQPTPTPTPAPIIFAVIGDYGSNEPAEEDVAALVLSWQPDFILTVGDNNYPYGSEQTIDDTIGQYYHSYIYPYTGSYGAGADTNRFFPTLGNHDILTELGRPYLDYFTLPGNERYYDFTWGAVHFFALDNESNEPDGVGRSSLQAQWLQAQMAASSLPWKIVYMHYPAYSSGTYGPTDWAQWPFAEWGATAVLAGHDHIYERLTVGGIPYFVNGLGGGAIYEFISILPFSEVRYNSDYGAMRVEASPARLLFQFLTRWGEVIDTFELTR